MVAEPTKRNGWERGRIIRTVSSFDGRCRQVVVQIGTIGHLLRPVSRLALLDVRSSSEPPQNSGLHPGETVDAEKVERATLCTDKSSANAPNPHFKATRRSNAAERNRPFHMTF